DRPKRKLALVTDPVVKPRGVYHFYSVSEAVINALMHRDLALRDIRTRINIYDHAIELVNPRRTNGFSPPASRAIRYGIRQRLNAGLRFALDIVREYLVCFPARYIQSFCHGVICHVAKLLGVVSPFGHVPLADERAGQVKFLYPVITRVGDDDQILGGAYAC